MCGLRWCFRLLALTAVVLTPILAHAQGSITGVARDTSGAVLPGVTVEAASPALIEKVRTAVTDGTGQYRIVDLRPGTYAVTFTLPGFATVRREGIEIAGSFTATVNGELRVGELAETITVTSESPIVDVQSTRGQRVITNEVIDTIPSGRNHRLYSVLIPGMTSSVQDVGGTNALQLGAVAIHGGRPGDQRLMVDGLTLRNTSGTGSNTNFVPDMGSAQEVMIDYAAASVETMTGGVNFNYIPKEGGNQFAASLFGTYVNTSFQGDNYSDELKAQGLGAPNALKRLYDYNPTGGGPIKRDRLWIYSSARFQNNDRYTAGLWDNLNSGDPSKWLYAPDLSRQSINTTTQKSVNTRFTWQASQRNKVNASYETQTRDLWTFASTVSKEAAQHFTFPRLHLATVSWASPVSNRLLLDVRAMKRAEDIRNIYPEDPSDPFRSLIRVEEQGGLIPGLFYRGAGNSNNTSIGSFTDVMISLWEVKGSLSYVTGAHAFKVGFSNHWGDQASNSYDVPTATSYRFNNGVPNQIIERQATYLDLIGGIRSELGVYAQDKWTVDRLTINPGVRFDYFHSGFDEFHLGPAPLVPTRNFTFPESSWYRFKDLSPRVGVTYDLFGNGKTALKGNFSRFTESIFPLDGNPMSDRLVNRVTRSWIDANSNFTPDCDLINPNAQDLRPVGGDSCGTISDLRFGQTVPSTIYDAATLEGWGARGFNWEFSTGIQHALMPRVGLDVSFFRRWYGNFKVTDNRAVAATDFSPFSIPAPADARLPGGGSYMISDLYNLNPNRVGQVDNYVTLASNYGKQTEHWNGLDINLNARPSSGVLLQGGVSTGRTSTDNCEILAALPEIAPVGRPFCQVTEQFQTQVKILGSYTLSKVDVQLSGTFQSLPGPQILANFVASNALVQSSLGRPLSGGAANVTVNLVQPGTLYGDRMNQLDVRVAKIVRFGRHRVTGNLDIYNLFNGNTVRTVNNNYASWQTPTGILDPRLFKISAQIDF